MKTFKAFAVIFFVFFMLFCIPVFSQNQSDPIVTITADKTVYTTGSTINIKVTIKNPGESNLVIYDFPYLTAKNKDGKEIEFLSKDLLKDPEMYNNKDHFISIDPKSKKDIIYPFIIKPNFNNKIPMVMTAVIRYENNRRESENYYSKKDTAERVLKIPVKAWFGNLVSKPVKIIIIRKTNEQGDITNIEANEIAREICLNEGWKFVDENIKDNKQYFDITTNYGKLGSNVFIRIDKKNGNIIEKHITGP